MQPVSEMEMEMELKQELVQKGSGQLTRSDCLCPICLEIFLEPVTLPCEHTFCKPCFLDTVDKANMSCPLCRMRVSIWARLNGRKKTLVNVELWKRIQNTFPIQCQRRLNGIEEEEEIDMLIPKPKLSQPGELRQEYEDQVRKLMAEKQAMEEAERRASEDYIRQLLAVEEAQIAEEGRRQEIRQLEKDEQLARLLSEELNSTPVLESHSSVKPNDAASTKKRKPSVGHIEKTNFSSKKSLDTDLAEETNFHKRHCGSVRLEPSPQVDILQRMAMLEETLWSQLQQEEEDRRLAQRLQRKLDREPAVDRSKGSADGYLLREKSSPSSTSTSLGEERGNTSDSLKTEAGRGKKSSRASSRQEGKTTKKIPVFTQSSPSMPSAVPRG